MVGIPDCRFATWSTGEEARDEEELCSPGAGTGVQSRIRGSVMLLELVTSFPLRREGPALQDVY